MLYFLILWGNTMRANFSDHVNKIVCLHDFSFGLNLVLSNDLDLWRLWNQFHYTAGNNSPKWMLKVWQPLHYFFTKAISHEEIDTIGFYDRDTTQRRQFFMVFFLPHFWRSSRLVFSSICLFFIVYSNKIWFPICKKHRGKVKS